MFTLKFLKSYCFIIYIYVIFNNHGTTQGACDNSQFECDNGNCILQFDVCDGIKNCPDGSDETAKLCVTQRVHCSKPYFQCTYGGCVIGTASCNGRVECADGSDETRLRCASPDDKAEFDRRLQGNCQENELKCPHGNCIDKHLKLCDGKDDCGDGYDESVELCGHIDCPEYSFQCGYGGCIQKTLMCNGQFDCYDGSDEAPLLCKTINPNKTAESLLPVLTDQRGCPLPLGEELPILKNQNHQIITPPITKGLVHFSCNLGYVLVGHSSSHCTNKKWSGEGPPKCIRYCISKDAIFGYSTKPSCSYDGQHVNCMKYSHPPGTEVTFKCASGFKNPSATNLLVNMKCQNSGRWSGERPHCAQECGQIAIPTRSFSADGYEVPNKEFPWHLGLYAKHNEMEYTYKCGGSLITPDIVITAAHCMYEEASNRKYNESIFQVVASKFYRDYDRNTGEEIKNHVKEIIIPSNYKGKDDNYYNDLAILILTEPFELSELVRPICLQFSERGRKESVNNNVHGKFAGWDIKDNHTLQFVLAQSKTHADCVANYNENIRDDKFCILTEGKARACQGDSGGGFASKRDYYGNEKRYYLYGVISNAPNSVQCAESVTVLTNIEYFENEIKYVLKQSREKFS